MNKPNTKAARPKPVVVNSHRWEKASKKNTDQIKRWELTRTQRHHLLQTPSNFFYCD